MAKITIISFSFILLCLQLFSVFFFIIPLQLTGAAVAALETASAYQHRSSYKYPRFSVEEQCRGTLYPRLCVECLSRFISNNSSNNPPPTAEELAQIALKVSLVKARYTRSYIAKVAADMKQRKAKEYAVVKECLDQISDGVDQITHSVKEMGRMTSVGGINGRRDNKERLFSWHQSNVETWMSTALTDASTCMDNGFPAGHAMGSKAKAIIRAKILNVAQATSNALAFFNRFVARHKASPRRSTKP